MASELLPRSLPSVACSNGKTIVTRANWDPLRFATCHSAPFYVLLGIRLWDASACMPLVANTRICDKFRYSDRLCDDTLPRVLTVRSPVHYRLLIASIMIRPVRLLTSSLILLIFSSIYDTFKDAGDKRACKKTLRANATPPIAQCHARTRINEVSKLSLIQAPDDPGTLLLQISCIGTSAVQSSTSVQSEIRCCSSSWRRNQST